MNPNRYAFTLALVCLAVLLKWSAAQAQDDRSQQDRSPSGPRVIISTDVSLGLIDTHGGKSLTPVSLSLTSPWSRDADVVPQDMDDGLALAMALNLDASHEISLLGVYPTYGNASLPAEMMVARQIVRNLKKRRNLPIVPGASGPVSQVLHDTPIWFDGKHLPSAGVDGSFAAACVNAAVLHMRRTIQRSHGPVTILAIGPLTDVACLLQTSKPSVVQRIHEIIAIASRVEGESVQINGLVVNDFNFRMDPVAGTLMLAMAGRRDVPVRLMSFSLTGQTSQADSLIPFTADSYPGPPRPRPRDERSFAWLLEAAEPRNVYWSGIFGTDQGPFDQYAVMAAIEPELFDCRPALAYVQQCSFPAWSEAYAIDDQGNPVNQPYNTPDNPCIDHGSAHGASLSEVPAQLIATLNTDDPGLLVRGEPGIDGNLPALDLPAQPVTACIDFADAAARETFEERLKALTW
jgi:inosine-uridine nucleoside N-ribohydrolase